MKPAIVFIDDGYLKTISKHFGFGKGGKKLDINQFAVTLAKSQGLWCKEVHFYTAPPFQSETPTPDEALRKANHDVFITKLGRIPNFYVHEGRCQKINSIFKQKGVDTLLTMGLTKAASQPNKDVILLLACDTDFVPVLEHVRASGNEVVLFYYNDFIRGSQFAMSNHILTACDKSVLLKKEHFEASIKQ